MNKTIKLLACSKNEKFYKTSTGKILTKHKLISLIKNNKAIVTTSSGTEVSVIILDGKSFLRTNHNSKEKDNLASALASFEIWKHSARWLVSLLCVVVIASNVAWPLIWLHEKQNKPLVPPGEKTARLQLDNTRMDIGMEQEVWATLEIYNFDSTNVDVVWNDGGMFDISSEGEWEGNTHYYTVALKNTVVEATTGIISVTVDGIESNSYPLQILNIPDLPTTLTIDETNGETYFNGTWPALTTAKSTLGDFLATNDGAAIDTLIFKDITHFGAYNMQYDTTTAFPPDASYITSYSGQIHTLDFRLAAPTYLGSSHMFQDTLALTRIYLPSAAISPYMFQNSSVEEVYFGGGETISNVQPYCFYNCRFLRLLSAKQWTTVGGNILENSFSNAGVSASGVSTSGVVHGTYSSTFLTEVQKKGWLPGWSYSTT